MADSNPDASFSLVRALVEPIVSFAGDHPEATLRALRADLEAMLAADSSSGMLDRTPQDLAAVLRVAGAGPNPMMRGATPATARHNELTALERRSASVRKANVLSDEAAATRFAMSRIVGRNPAASAQTMTPGYAPDAGWINTASQVPSLGWWQHLRQGSSARLCRPQVLSEMYFPHQVVAV